MALNGTLCQSCNCISKATENNHLLIWLLWLMEPVSDMKRFHSQI